MITHALLARLEALARSSLAPPAPRGALACELHGHSWGPSGACARCGASPAAAQEALRAALPPARVLALCELARQALPPPDLTTAYATTLLRAVGGTTTYGAALHARIGGRRSALYRLIHRLLEAGLLELVPHRAVDRRRYVRMTAAGHRFLAEVPLIAPADDGLGGVDDA